MQFDFKCSIACLDNVSFVDVVDILHMQKKCYLNNTVEFQRIKHYYRYSGVLFNL